MIKKIKITKVLALVLASCCWLIAPAAGWAANLTQIKVDPTLAEKMTVELVFDGPVAQYSDRLHYNPNFLTIHLPGSGSSLPLEQLPIERGSLKSIEAGVREGNLDVTLHLSELQPYYLQAQGNRLVVHLGTPPGNTPAQSSPPAVGAINRITGFDFRRGPGQSGQLVVNLQQLTAAVDLQRRGQKLLIEFHATDILPELLYIMDVSDFGTQVRSIESFKEGNVARLELNVEGPFDYRYEQLGSRLVVDILKPPAKTGSSADQPSYQGRPISLNFQDIPVRTVLQLIADFNQLNLVAADSVQGNITLRLEGVPWEQALDIILKIKGLDKRLEGNILMVAPAAELAEYEKSQLASRQQVAELTPLQSEFLQINYAKAAQIAELLKSADTSLLSERGRVTLDERTNTLLIKDTTESIDNIKRLLKVLDIPVKQVVIEARMVTVNDSVGQELGIRWGITDSGSLGSSNTTTSGSLEAGDSVLNGTLPSLDDRLNVNLPVADAAGSIAFQMAKLADGRILDLELSALELENKAEIIASPRITTANQKEAYIEQGVEIPYVQASSSGATSVTFKKAVLSLQVTPQITPDNKLILDLIVTQDTKGETVPTAVGNAVAIDTQRITTQVLVDNGDTVVLGGIFQQQQLNTVKKVPLLGDLPGVGALFRSTSESNQKRELLIFVTPRIVVEAF